MNNNRSIVLVLIIFCLLYFLFFISALILPVSTKILLLFIFIPTLIIYYLITSAFGKIILPIVMITFPITLQFLGKDAISTGTLILLITLAWSLNKHSIRSAYTKDKFLFNLLVFMICVALIGMITKTPPSYWGTAIRYFLNFISSIAIFILIVNSQYITGMGNNRRDYVEKLITVLLCIIVTHVLLSYVLMKIPQLEDYFVLFFRRNQESLLGSAEFGSFRAATIFTGGEEFGELLTLMFPFSLYKYFSSRKKLYLIILFTILWGVMLTATRSCIVICIFQLLIFFIIAPNRFISKKIAFLSSAVFGAILFYPRINQTLSYLLFRINDVFRDINTNLDFVTVVNRDYVWPLAYDLTVKTISLFGHGPIQAFRLGFSVYNFHSLYLSLLFQFGIIGTAVFMVFFATLIKRLFSSTLNMYKQKNVTGYLLLAVCQLSLMGFLINEIKFEFNRSDSYQQLVWLIFSIYYLTWQIYGNNKNEEKKTDLYYPDPIWL